jgi:hypothetical protein
MKLPFKKSKVTAAPDSPTETLQSLQQEFNQVVFEIGDLTYRKVLATKEIARLNDEINNRTQKADAMGVRAASLRAKAQQELNKTIEQGKANETTDKDSSKPPAA